MGKSIRDSACQSTPEEIEKTKSQNHEVTKYSRVQGATASDQRESAVRNGMMICGRNSAPAPKGHRPVATGGAEAAAKAKRSRPTRNPWIQISLVSNVRPGGATGSASRGAAGGGVRGMLTTGTQRFVSCRSAIWSHTVGCAEREFVAPSSRLEYRKSEKSCRTCVSDLRDCETTR